MAITTPLGDDALLLRGFQGADGISQLFRFDIDMLSTDEAIDLEAVVGKKATLRLTLADESERYFNGVVSTFSQGSRDGNFTNYRAELVPWLWLLTRKADCRIFQHKTVPQIIEAVFAAGGYQDYSMKALVGPFPEREYCVQYRETDFNFVSRLMEEEGIYYFFQHENGTHTMMLANTPDGHPECPDQAVARYHTTGQGRREEDVIDLWQVAQDLRPGRYTLNDFNFEDPYASLIAQASSKDNFEVYDYPGEYARQPEGQRLSRIRLEECDTPRTYIRAASDCRAFSSGFKFKLADHYRGDANKPYVLTRVQHTGTQPGNYRSTSAADSAGSIYRNLFECIPFSTPFRPSRVTPKPIVQGTQTAIVVGPKGEEIYTDKYGRVKVQFHWDRVGQRNENSSCWIRVSQPWAGKNWGTVSIPRIGQEVVVDFLEGDPDKPLIIGRVYNADQMPPYTLPSGADLMGFKSNSTKGGGGYNEIVIKDGKAGELIRIHAQKDMDTTVLNNDTQHVVVDRTIQVDGKHNETVKKEIVVKSSEDQIYMEASTQITLVVGESSLFMDKSGNIVLKGKHVTVIGSDMIDLNP